MIKFMFSILLVIIAVAIWFPIGNEGNIVIEHFGYHVEISSILAIAIVIAAFIIFYFFIHFLVFIKNIPSSLKKYYKETQEHNDLLLLLHGFDALYSNDLNEMKKIVKKINHNKNHEQMQLMKPLISLFITQYNESLHKNDSNNEEELENSYQELLHYDTSKMVGLKGLITLRMSRKRYNDALFYAEKAFTINAKTDWLLKYLIEIYTSLELYEKAEKVIKKAEDYSFIDKEETNALLISNYVTNASSCITNSEVKKAILLLEKALKIDQACNDAVFMLARLYSQDNNKKLSHKIIEKAWKKSPSIALAKFILNIDQNYTITKKVKLLENLISEAPEDKAGYLVLSELYIAEDMLPQARAVMDKLLSLHAPDSYMSKLMALIETKSQNNYSIIINWLYKI